MTTDRLPPARLFLADHLLRDAAGHHLGYNLALADAARRAGVAPRLVTHRGFDPALAGSTRVERRFRTDWRANPPEWIARRHRLLSGLEWWCDRRFGADLRAFPTAEKTDAIFAQMLAPRHFQRWLRWMRAQPFPPVLFLHLGYRPGRFETSAIARARRELPPELRRRVVFVTDSEKLVEPFARILGGPVHCLPHIVSYDLPPATPKSAAGPCVVFVPGNARREKGFVEVCRAIDLVRETTTERDLHFVVQCHDPDPVCARVLRDRAAGAGLEWIHRPLGDAEYTGRLGRADVVLLPYHLDLYELRTSGIFCEARVAGKPVVASRRSWAGDRIAREGGGWLVEEKDASALADTLRAVPAGLPAKESEARALAPGARAEFHRDAFLRGLLDLFDRASHVAA